MTHMLFFAACALGAGCVLGTTLTPTARWLDREFRYARGLRVLCGMLGAVLTVGAAICLVDPSARWGEFVVALAALVLLLAVLAGPYLRRRALPTLRPRRILAVGAHPDDLELACGATLAKLVDEGHEVHTMVMSRGRVGGDHEARGVEARVASRYLGAADTAVLDFEDTALRSHERQMVSAIEKAIAGFRPDVILTHSANDQHQDHEAVHLATLRAARRCPSILCFESPSVTRAFSPGFFVDVSEYVDVKTYAIGLHRDQRGKPYMGGRRAQSAAAFRGDQARLRFAEGFEVVRLSGSSIGDF